MARELGPLKFCLAAAPAAGLLVGTVLATLGAFHVLQSEPARNVETAMFWTMALAVLAGVAGLALAVYACRQLQLRRALESETERTESAMRHLQAIVAHVADGLLIFDQNGMVTSCNPAAERLFGATHDQVAGRHLKLLFEPKDGDALGALVSAGDAGARALTGVRRDGSRVPLEVAVGVIPTNDGEMFVAVCRDTTERQDAATRLREKNAELGESNRMRQAILDAAGYGIVSTDAYGVIRSFNRAAEELFGWAAEDVIGKQTPAVFHKREEIFARARQLSNELGRRVEPGFYSFVARAQRGEVDESEWTIVRHDGTEIPGRLTLSAIRDERGEVTGYLGIARDVTIEHRAAASLERARTDAEQVSQTKSDFLADLAGELRAPLNAIMGATGLLNPDRPDEPAARVQHAGRHMLAVVNDVLDLARIEAGRAAVHATDVDVVALCEDLIALVRPQAEAGGNFVTLELCDGVDRLVTDGSRLRQVLYNLLANAARFTLGGEIRLVATADEDAETGRPAVVFRVTDTGVGMSPDDMDRAFAPFVRLHEGPEAPFVGTGLGLPLCRATCRLLGGSINGESAPGAGTAFTVRVPSAAPSSERRRPRRLPLVNRDARAFAGPTVLVVDDDTRTLAVTRQALVAAGYNVLAADSGDEGLRLARLCAPHAVVLSALLREMDAWTFVAALRADRQLAGIAVVLLAVDPDADAGVFLPATGYVTCPLESEDLVRAIRRPGGPQPTGRALVVASDGPTLEDAEQLLAAGDWTVTTAGCGGCALDDAAEELPDLMLVELPLAARTDLVALESLHDRSGRALPTIGMLRPGADGEPLRESVRDVLKARRHTSDETLAAATRMVRHLIGPPA